MAFESFYTDHYRMPFFGDGHLYSAEADRQRFVTLDRNLESYIGIVGIGVIQGWVPTSTSGLSVSVTWGDGFINGYYSESGWDVKLREDVLPSDIVIQEEFYVDEVTGDIYDKIEYVPTMTVPDNSDVFLYAYRNSNYSITSPYLDPDNEYPEAETTATLSPSRSATSFGYAATKALASTGGKVFIGQVTTRSGSVTQIDVSQVRSLANFEGALREYAEFVLKSHKHGGDGDYDPQSIRLQTDRRDMILSSVVGDSIVFIAKNSEVSTTELDHYHTYSIDSSGNGITVDSYGDADWHFHEISSFSIGGMKGSVAIEDHSHELSLPEDYSDGWSQSDPVQIYINGEPYYGDNAIVDATNKQVTFVGDVTVKFRKYGIDHQGWIYESEERSLYRFMLKAALAYAKDHDGNNVIVPDPATPITVLRRQCLTGDPRLVDVGDTFTFVLDAADNVTVTLLEAAHVDDVEIEILTNSEVTGRLPEGNILYIPASKIVTGEFEPELIPMLSHIGRFLEGCSPRSTRARSVDGRVYESEREDVFGNVKIVHSIADDGSGTYVIGTSDGIYRKPSGGSYLFVVNGVHVVTDPGNIEQRIQDAILRYNSKTGISVLFDSAYDSQIQEATVRVAAVGDYYKFVGNRNEAVDDGFDVIWLFFVDKYRLTEYGYETLRFDGEILPDEEIVREIPQEVDPDSEDDVIPLYLVRNDFHKWTPKDIFIEHNLVSGYDGSVSNKFYSVTSSEIFTSTSIDREWKKLVDSGIDGYIYDFAKSYGGAMAAVTSSGLKLSTRSSGTAFRHVKLPVFGSDPRAVSMGYGTRLIVGVSGSIIVTDNFGQSWSQYAISGSDIMHIFHDASADVTGTVSGHYHSVSVNALGDGQTSTESGHYHQIEGGVVQEFSGHTHAVYRKYYAMSRSGQILVGMNGGATWINLTSIPSDYDEWGIPFAAFGSVYVPVDGVLAKFDGSQWTRTSPFDGSVYSSQWSYNNDAILLGSVNSAYSFDGTVATEIYSDTGLPVPKVYFNSIPKKFGFILNNAYNSYDLGGDIYLGTSIDVVDSFSQFYPEYDGWPDGIPYDLYLNDRLVKSTKKGVDRTGDIYVSVSNVSVIDFSMSSTLSSPVSVGDVDISVADASLFPEYGTVSILQTKSAGEMFAKRLFYDYYAKSGNSLLLSSPSIYSSATDLVVSYSSQIGGDDDVKITVYDGKIDNVGDNTHESIEDALTFEDAGLPRRLADVYESNLTHLIIASKYIYPSIDSEMENMFSTTFNYSFTPGDPLYIDRFIDREKSDLASLSIYSVDGLHSRSSAIRRVVAGFGAFSGKVFVASNIGLFMMDSSLTLESNWSHVRVGTGSEAYDVFQYDNDTIYVAMDSGLYINDDAEFSSWSLIDSQKIGGAPTRITPRWGPLVDEESGIDYWWGDWTGPVHENEDLINTIIVSGDGFLSHSDDRGISWLDGKFYDSSGNRVLNLSPVSYTLLRNGSMATCARNADGSLWGIYVSTGTGSRWTEMYSVSSIYGSINSMRVSDNLNVVLSVSFSSDAPSDDLLVGRELVIGEDTFVVVSNSSDTVTVFGDGIVDSDGTSFEIKPWNLNVLHEDSEKRLSVGSSVGMLWDNGGFFGDDRARDGSVVSVGHRATIDSVNISGHVEMSVPFSDKTIISAVIGKHVVADELVGMTMKFNSSSVPDMEIISNGTGRHDSTVSITVSGDTSSLVNRDRFVIEGVDFVRVYVTYEGTVSKGDLDGGTIVISPEDYDYRLTRENYPIMRIVSNTDSYIEISREFDGPEGTDPISALVLGASVVASNSDGTVPVVVDFDVQRGVNEIRDNFISVRGSDSFPSDGRAKVISNDEISIVVSETYEGTDEDGNSATYSVFNTILDGEEFYLSYLPFVPRSGFNDTKSSLEAGHFHDYVEVPGPITGTVSGFGAVSSFGVELMLDDVVGLDNATVQSNPDLFAGDTLLAYRRDNPSIKYRMRIISHNSIAESITVSRLDANFDFVGDDGKKVGDGYSVLLNTGGYGETTSTRFTERYVVSTTAIVEDAFIGDDVITVSSIDGIGAGAKIRVTDDTGISFMANVSSVSGYEVSLSSPLLVDLLVEKSARGEVMYGRIEVGEYTLSSTASQGDFDIYLSDASMVLPGDIVEIYDGSGMSDSHVVSSVAAPVVSLSTAVGRDYVSGSEAIVRRENFSGSHSHIVRRRQFDIYDDVNGGHGHYLSSLIGEVFDIKSFFGLCYAVGSGNFVYYSSDNGESWPYVIDVSKYPEFSPLPSYISGVYRVGEDTVAFSSSSGYVIYQSDDYVRFAG